MPAIARFDRSCASGIANPKNPISTTLPENARSRKVEVVLTVFSMPILGHRFAIVVAPSLHLAITRSLEITSCLSFVAFWLLLRQLLFDLEFALLKRLGTLLGEGDCDYDILTSPEDHVLSFRFHARKIRRAIDAVCTLRSATRRKLRSRLLQAVRELAPLLYDRERGSCILCT